MLVKQHRPSGDYCFFLLNSNSCDVVMNKRIRTYTYKAALGLQVVRPEIQSSGEDLRRLRVSASVEVECTERDQGVNVLTDPQRPVMEDVSDS